MNYLIKKCHMCKGKGHKVSKTRFRRILAESRGNYQHAMKTLRSLDLICTTCDGETFISYPVIGETIYCGGCGRNILGDKCPICRIKA